MERKIISVAAFMGMTAIVLGAFGAHALKKELSVEQLSSFETGVKYQMYHALFLLFLGQVSNLSEKVKKRVFQLVLFGVFFFSGSIYLLTTKAITGIDFRFIGIVTPIGGALLIVAWGVLFWYILKSKR
ncbi:DUF423 domain-containing protein [Flavobacterium sp.]|jgi:uncharacterized membrane protein YgdD (TMEM256/DUF423 family)|uniref:DUF423 domain-containing protein n=1 Tax=Flavobacterium sp. TaxID=239 RepID=UPI0037BFC02F